MLKPIQFLVEEDIYLHLKQLALDERTTVSELIRASVENLLVTPEKEIHELTPTPSREAEARTAADKVMAPKSEIKYCEHFAAPGLCKHPSCKNHAWKGGKK